MKLRPNKLHYVQIPRNNVLGGYTKAYKESLIARTRFRRKFLEYWNDPSSATFSLFTHVNRIEMTRLLGIGREYGTDDLTTANIPDIDKIDDIVLVWKDQIGDAIPEYRAIAMAKIKERIDSFVDGYFLEFTSVCTVWVEPIGLPPRCDNWEHTVKVDGTELIDDVNIAIYEAINELLGGDVSNKKFRWEDVAAGLEYKVFDEVQCEGYRCQSERGIPVLSNLGIVPQGAWVYNPDRTALEALDPYEFFEFVQAHIKVDVREKKNVWGKILVIAMIFVTIILIAEGVYWGFDVAASGGTFAQAVAAGLSIASGIGVAGLGSGIYAALLVASSAYGAFSSMQMLTKDDPEAVNSPEEIDTKVSMANELYWTYTDSVMPPAQIEGAIQYGRP